jgi:hypothetical protein
MYRSDFFQQSPLRIVEPLHDRSEYTHIVAQAANLARQPLEVLCDGSTIDRLAGVVAQPTISIPRGVNWTNSTRHAAHYRFVAAALCKA